MECRDQEPNGPMARRGRPRPRAHAEEQQHQGDGAPDVAAGVEALGDGGPVRGQVRELVDPRPQHLVARQAPGVVSGQGDIGERCLRVLEPRGGDAMRRQRGTTFGAAVVPRRSIGGSPGSDAKPGARKVLAWRGKSLVLYRCFCCCDSNDCAAAAPSRLVPLSCR